MPTGSGLVMSMVCVGFHQDCLVKAFYGKGRLVTSTNPGNTAVFALLFQGPLLGPPPGIAAPSGTHLEETFSLSAQASARDASLARRFEATCSVFV